MNPYNQAMGSQLASQGLLCKPGYDLGGQGFLAVGLAPIRLLQISAEREQDPLVVAISIDVKTVEAFPAASDHRAIGRCEWGSKRGGGSIVFDLRHGCRMTLDASHVTLSAEMLGTVSGGKVRVASSIAYGSVTGPSSLTFTEATVSLAAGITSSPLEIPSYARRVAVFTDSSAPLATGAFLTSDAGGATVIGRFSVSNGMEAVQIPNGAEFIQLTNAAAVGANFTPFYELVV
jgi:hypothetical protein